MPFKASDFSARFNRNSATPEITKQAAEDAVKAYQELDRRIVVLRYSGQLGAGSDGLENAWRLPDIYFHAELFAVFYPRESAICAEREFGQNS